MLDCYWGEFLTNCVPLEISLSYCSHKCAFCYANLNQPDRNTVAAMLLKRGYPVLASNRVDPFAMSNYKVFLPILETMTAMGIQVMFQTRGGRGIDEALDMIGPSVWYVSIALDDEARREAIEPGAPTLASRHDLIDKLIDAGHTVVVGLNPLVPEWLPDPEPLLSRFKAQGVHGVWIERLHFNRKQSGQLSARDIAAMGEDVIERAHKRKPAGDFEFFLRTREQAADVGLEVYSMNQPTASAFFEPYHALYRQTFPVMQDWINHLHATMPDGGLVTFDDFLGFFGPQFPDGVHAIDSYLGATAHNLWHTHKIPTTMTYAQLLALIWSEGRIKHNPVRSPAFAMASYDGAPIQDERGMPVMVFVPQWTYDYWIDLAQFEEVA